MRILITNDDGIGSSVLPRLAEWAKKLGDVTVVVPKTEQSGMSQAIDFHRTSEIKRVPFPVDCEAWTMDSTPADCVRFATVGLHRSYDLVLSGINRGYNIGHDISYSGTVGAILEASRLGMKAIALSTDVTGFDPALSELDKLYEYITQKNFLSHVGLLNINLPACESRGILITRQGGDFFSDEFIHKGNDMYIQVGAPVCEGRNDLTIDIDAVLSGYISITPLTAARTDFNAYDILRTI